MEIKPTPPLSPSITCPKCGMTSYHPEDVKQGYCGNCHDWTGPTKGGQMPKVATIEKCVCARRKTVPKGILGRPVQVLVGSTTCEICRGAGLTDICSKCGGAGLAIGSTFGNPIKCDECNGHGRIPYRGEKP